MSSSSTTDTAPPLSNDNGSISLPDKSEFLVTDLGNVTNYEAFGQFEGDMYAGLLPSDNGNRTGNMMFWLFEPKKQAVPDSMIIWLNGGPGCSSFNCGLLMEISPVTQPQHDAGYCCLNAEPKFSYNNHTWTRATTLLFVEQPIGTGFSYGNAFPQDEHDVSKDLDAFLQNLYKVFPHLAKYDFYVTGESYAGMFIPSIARHIHLENKKAISDNDSSRQIVPLKGAALGNGWIEAKVQGPAVIDYSWWHGLIDKPTRDALHTEWRNCMAIRQGKAKIGQPSPFHPFNVQDDCGMMWGVLKASGWPNAYDITTWDPNVDQVTFASEAFFNNPQVQAAIHAPKGIVWHGCRVGEGRRRRLAATSSTQHHRMLYMDNDRPLSVVQYIADLVDDGIPVLVYNGDRDMTTNMVGTELALNAMEWSGQDDWLDAKRGLWMVDEHQAGWAKEHGNLAFVTVYNSGHMVPYNRPIQAYDLLMRLLTHKSFIDDEMPLVRVKPIKGSEEYDYSMPEFNKAALVDEPREVPLNNPASIDHWNTAGVAVVSMIIGFVLALIVMRRRPSSRGYQRVPDALDD